MSHSFDVRGMTIAAFLRRRRERREQRQSDCGYNWAAGQLLRGFTLLDASFDRDAFDDGISQARRDWRDRVRQEKTT